MVCEGSTIWEGKMSELHWERSDDTGSSRGDKGQCRKAEEDGSVSTSKCPQITVALRKKFEQVLLRFFGFTWGRKTNFIVG